MFNTIEVTFRYDALDVEIATHIVLWLYGPNERPKRDDIIDHLRYNFGRHGANSLEGCNIELTEYDKQIAKELFPELY